MITANVAILGKQDAESLVHLEHLCFTSGWTQKQYECFLNNRIDFDHTLIGNTAFDSVDTGRQEALQSLYQYFATHELSVLGLFSDKCFLLAYISLRNLGKEAEVYNIAVNPHFREKGLGSLLMKVALDIAKQCGIMTIFLEVRESNTPALALYHRMGFFKTGLRKSYYPDGENAVLMTCELDKSVKS